MGTSMGQESQSVAGAQQDPGQSQNSSRNRNSRNWMLCLASSQNVAGSQSRAARFPGSGNTQVLACSRIPKAWASEQ